MNKFTPIAIALAALAACAAPLTPNATVKERLKTTNETNNMMLVQASRSPNPIQATSEVEWAIEQNGGWTYLKAGDRVQVVDELPAGIVVIRAVEDGDRLLVEREKLDYD